jgi:hypothetical protein
VAQHGCGTRSPPLQQGRRQTGRGTAMANWKKLTSVDNATVYINIDNVAYIRKYRDHTTIYFTVQKGEFLANVSVRESPETISELADLV